MAKKQKSPKRVRYYGLVKPKVGGKACWISMQNKNGWSLGYAVNGRDFFLRNVRFASIKEIERALKQNVVFVHKKGK